MFHSEGVDVIKLRDNLEEEGVSWSIELIPTESTYKLVEGKRNMILRTLSQQLERQGQHRENV